MEHSKFIGFCADCGRPIDASARRCQRCNAIAGHAIRLRAVAAGTRVPSEGRPDPWRSLSDDDRAAIRAADLGIPDVELAWQFGVGGAEIARIRGAGDADRAR